MINIVNNIEHISALIGSTLLVNTVTYSVLIVNVQCPLFPSQEGISI